MCSLKSPMSQVLSNTSVEVFVGTKTWGNPPSPHKKKIVWGKGGEPPPMGLRNILNQLSFIYIKMYT